MRRQKKVRRIRKRKREPRDLETASKEAPLMTRAGRLIPFGPVSDTTEGT